MLKYTLLFSLSILVINYSQAQNSVEALDTTINSAANELNPIIHPDGKSLYFTRANHIGNIGGKKDKGDIWVSKWEENGWQPAKNVGFPLNNSHFNVVLGFSDDGNKIFLQNHYSKEASFLPKQGISVSYRQGDSWSFPEPVSMKYYYSKSEHQSASLSQDGKIMLLSMESYVTYGAEDIYVSFLRSNGEWTDPLNLGMDINTRFQEMTATLLKDNKTLIFSSNGHGGEGSADLFYSERLDDTWTKWSKPQNMGKTINTRGRELYYSIDPDETYAYFISTQNSEGYGDIKRVKLEQDDLAVQVEEFVAEVPEPVFEPDVTNEPEISTEPEIAIEPEISVEPDEVLTPETEPEKQEENVIRAIVVEGRITNIKSQENIAGRIVFSPVNAQQKAVTFQAENGLYRVQLNPGNYSVKATSKGFMTLEEEISIGSENMSISRNFELSPLDIGSTFRLSNVLFSRGTTELLESSYPELNRVVDMLQENPSIKIQLSGHTDNQGVARLNLKLSQERVETVKKYLIERGVDNKRITGKGYGGSQPVAPNSNEESRQLNRRVEFTIIQN